VIGNKRPSKKGKIDIEQVNPNANASVNGNSSATENDSSTTFLNTTNDNPVDMNAIHPDSDAPNLEKDKKPSKANGSAANCPIDETNCELDESVLNESAIDESVLDESIMTEATDISKEPSVSSEMRKIVVIDIIHVEQLLNTIVQKTSNYQFVKLLRLHCKLVRTVDRFMKLWDRSSLIKVCS